MKNRSVGSKLTKGDTDGVVISQTLYIFFLKEGN